MNRPDELRFSEQVAQIRTQFGASECARLFDVKPNTVHRWVKTGRASEQHRRQVENLQMVGELFAQSGAPEVALPWLHGMNPAFGDETAVDEILHGRWVLVISAARDYVQAG